MYGACIFQELILPMLYEYISCYFRTNNNYTDMTGWPTLCRYWGHMDVGRMPHSLHIKDNLQHVLMSNSLLVIVIGGNSARQTFSW